MSIRCCICPHNCQISENNWGQCGVRGCYNEKLYLPFSGLISAASIDPIEKKPLYHYKPGESIYSIGFYGCNLSCPFCQNYSISNEFQKNKAKKPDRPDDIIKKAVENKSFGIAYTYSEPIVHFEWITECAKKAQASGLKNILVTNGFINVKPSYELLKYIDAVNIDLKSFQDKFYRDELKGSLKPVLKFIKLAAESVHTELTTLVIPGSNDSLNEINEAADFIADININIPWHLSAYYPAYKYSQPATSPEQLLKLIKAASKKLNFVYAGNIIGRSNTICPSCNNLLINRDACSTLLSGISDGKCTACGADVKNFGIML